jgi:hypothetical protein
MVIGGGLVHCIALPPLVVGVAAGTLVAGAGVGAGLLHEGRISAAAIINRKNSFRIAFMVPQESSDYYTRKVAGRLIGQLLKTTHPD